MVSDCVRPDPHVFGTTANFAKTVEPIETPLGGRLMWAQECQLANTMDRCVQCAVAAMRSVAAITVATCYKISNFALLTGERLYLFL